MLSFNGRAVMHVSVYVHSCWQSMFMLKSVYVYVLVMRARARSVLCVLSVPACMCVSVEVCAPILKEELLNCEYDNYVMGIFILQFNSVTCLIFWCLKTPKTFIDPHGLFALNKYLFLY